MHGTPFASHGSATGLVVSGVDSTSIRSTLSSGISSNRRPRPRGSGSDWLSFDDDLDGMERVPDWMPSLRAASDRRSKTNLSASPKPASGPVWGLTKPILMVRPAAAPADTDGAVEAVGAPDARRASTGPRPRTAMRSPGEQAARKASGPDRGPTERRQPQEVATVDRCASGASVPAPPAAFVISHASILLLGPRRRPAIARGDGRLASSTR